MINNYQLTYHQVDEKLKPAFVKRLNKKVTILNNRLKKYTKPSEFIVRVEQPKQSQFIIFLHLVLPFKTISVQKTSDQLNKTLELAFTPLKENVFQALEEQTTPEESKTPTSSYPYDEMYSNLFGAVGVKNKDDIKSQIQDSLLSLARFIGRRIYYLEHQKTLKRGEVTTPPVLDEVVRRALSRKIPDEYTFYHWLYHLAEKVLDEIVTRKQNEEQNQVSWENQDNISIPDISDRTFISHKDVVIVDRIYEPDTTALEWLDKNNQSVSKDEVIQIVMERVSNLPRLDRQVFDLYAFQGLSIEEIADYLTIAKKEVES